MTPTLPSTLSITVAFMESQDGNPVQVLMSSIQRRFGLPRFLLLIYIAISVKDEGKGIKRRFNIAKRAMLLSQRVLRQKENIKMLLCEDAIKVYF